MKLNITKLKVMAIAAAAFMLCGGALVTSASAEAATMGSPARAAVARTAASAADSPASTSNNGCTSYYATGYNLVPPPDVYAYWTSNPCNYLLQVRAWCVPETGASGSWSTSGVVKAVDLPDTASCGFTEALTGGYIRFSYDSGATWTKYQRFFPS